MYGATDCDDTERTRNRLQELNIPFVEVNIDNDPKAEEFVIFYSNGYRSTPLLVFGDGKLRFCIVEPSDTELNEMLVRAGYSVLSN